MNIEQSNKRNKCPNLNTNVFWFLKENNMRENILQIARFIIQYLNYKNFYLFVWLNQAVGSIGLPLCLISKYKVSPKVEPVSPDRPII